ncbi:unnamed protein product [Linum trigynum]|uniref:Uncharacterized protein n=1 Tax=Linum trigynum TaxID=586398 RepID=A0AAV2CX15_9ROSI
MKGFEEIVEPVSILESTTMKREISPRRFASDGWSCSRSVKLEAASGNDGRHKRKVIRRRRRGRRGDVGEATSGAGGRQKRKVVRRM